MKRIKDLNNYVNNYYNKEIENIERLKKEKEQQKKKFNEETRMIKKEQYEIQTKIKSLKDKLNEKTNTVKLQNELKQKLQDEINDLPKSINFYNLKLEALEAKSKSMKSENMDENQINLNYDKELGIYRKLYGVNICVKDHHITFNFKEFYVTLKSENNKFTLDNSNLPKEIHISNIVEKLNKDGQTLNFIKYIKESLSF